MKKTAKKLLAILLSIILIAVPTVSVCAATTGDADDDLAFELGLIETSTLPQELIDVLVEAFVSYFDYVQALTGEDLTVDLGDEDLTKAVNTLITLVVTMVQLIQQIVEMAQSISGVVDARKAAA